jgi:hypothetical protein
MPIFRRPLMRSTPLDAGDHVNFRKIAPRSSYSCGEGFYFHHSAGADQSAFFAIALTFEFFNTIGSLHAVQRQVRY